MKTKIKLTNWFTAGLILLTILLYNGTNAQASASKAARPDTEAIQAITPPPDTVAQEEEKEKKESKRKDEFIVYAGVNFNQLSVASDQYESDMAIGYHLGGAYKRGKFFYWQAGARFNNAVYELKDLTGSSDSSFTFGVRNIDIPLTAGINFLSFTNRILALRLFISAVPSFAMGVGDNDLDIAKEDLNSFMVYGQGGIGVNVAFVVIEAGYNYGFQDILKDKESKPGQIFVNIGFRF